MTTTIFHAHFPAEPEMDGQLTLDAIRAECFENKCYAYVSRSESDPPTMCVQPTGQVLVRYRRPKSQRTKR